MGMLCACGPSKEEMEALEKQEREQKKDVETPVIVLRDGQVQIYEFHGCSYMTFVANNNTARTIGSHMGDCDNPIHKNNTN